MKLLREAQKRLAKELLRYKLKSQGVPPPPEAELDRQTEQLIEEANRVLGREGKKLLEEVKGGLRQALSKLEGDKGEKGGKDQGKGGKG